MLNLLKYICIYLAKMNCHDYILSQKKPSLLAASTILVAMKMLHEKFHRFHNLLIHLKNVVNILVFFHFVEEYCLIKNYVTLVNIMKMILLLLLKIFYIMLKILIFCLMI